MRCIGVISILSVVVILFATLVNLPCVENGRYYSEQELKEISLIYELGKRNNYSIERRSTNISSEEIKVYVKRLGSSAIQQYVGADSYEVEFMDSVSNSIISLNACGSVTSREFIGM